LLFKMWSCARVFQFRSIPYAVSGRILTTPASHSGVGFEWRDAGASNAQRKQQAAAVVG